MTFTATVRTAAIALVTSAALAAPAAHAGGIVSEGQGYGFKAKTSTAQSSGGAAGGIVSEGQGYGVFAAR